MNYFQYLLFAFLLLILPAWSFASESGVDQRIRDAEKELRLARAAHEKVTLRFDALEKDPEATSAQVLAMESYVYELGEMVKVREQILKDLQKIAGAQTGAPNPTVIEGMKDFEEAVSDLPEASDPETEAEKLEREFLASLESFDGMILAYNRKLEAQMDSRISKGETAVGARQSAAQEAEALLRSMGVDPGTGENAEVAGTEDSSNRNSSPEVAGNPSDTSGEKSVGAGGEGGSGGGRSRAPRRDEDIVARQLREAAEKETDPVLREKLWEEYEAYLNGQS